jgi:hypothetical protein
VTYAFINLFLSLFIAWKTENYRQSKNTVEGLGKNRTQDIWPWSFVFFWFFNFLKEAKQSYID